MSARSVNWNWPFRCSNCGRDYPEEGFHFQCPTCGGHFDPKTGLEYAPTNARGIERYRETFALPPGAEFFSLGEGDTPLVADQIQGRKVFFKSEHLNPTGSFKDRGTAVLVSALVSMGVEEAVEDSSGNAGASFAAYAARAGIQARVFVPDYASGPKRAQIERYGAELMRIKGPRSATTDAVLHAAEAGAVYASHAYLPHLIGGMATAAFEIAETLGRAPGAIISPVGQGTLMIGAYLGFKALLEAGAIDHMPTLIGVQAHACAPLWAVHTGGAARLDWVQEKETLAEGIRIIQPLRGDLVLQAVEETGGRFIAVEEGEIERGLRELAGRGFLVEPTSAVVWPALEQLVDDLEEPVVAMLTGSGFKVAPEKWPQVAGDRLGREAVR